MSAAGISIMGAKEYHALCSLSSGLAKTLIEKSPLHAWVESRALNPSYREKNKQAFDVGSGAHALLLEGEDRMAVVDAADWRTKIAKERRDEARAAGKHPVLAHVYEDVRRMVPIAQAAIGNCEELGLGPLGLSQGVAERVAQWTHAGTGVACRARPDWMLESGKLICDFKTTENATPSGFSGQIARMGYHYQAEFYAQGIAAALGLSEMPRFVFIVQEITAPYAVSFHACAPSLQALAARGLDYAAAEWAECLRTGLWPSHSNRIHYAEAMPWQVMESEERGTDRGIAYDPATLWAKDTHRPLIGLDHEGDPL